MIRALLADAVLAAAVLTGCASGPGDDDPLTVYAAASLRDAFEEIAASYEEDSGVRIVLSFDASSALRTQIVQGAPADLFFSADVANAQQVADAGLTDGDPSPFAANELVIVVPTTGEASVASWTSLADAGIRIIAAGDEVPVTRYAVELVAELAARPDAPPALVEAYEANIVSREDNVRAVLAKIEIGEGDAAIVYETDAASSDSVSRVALPDEVNVAAQYAFVSLVDAGPGAADFAAWVTGPAGQAILADFGFRPPAR